MKNSYIANTTEAANLYSGKQTAIVTLVKPQPIPANADKTAYNFDMGNSKHFHIAQNVSIEDMNTRFSGILDFAPYHTGQTIAVRESWAETCDEYGTPILAYKSDSKAFYIGRGFEILSECTTGWHIDNYPSCGSWRSPVTMPREAVRTWLLVKDVMCVRVQDMSSKQAQAIWPGMTNIERMQELHRKLGSDAWENNAFIFITIIEKQ